MPAAEVLIQTALLGEAVEAGPALIFVADEQMRYIAVNQFACSALGYTREELLGLYIGKGMKLLLAGNDLPMLTNAARTHQAKVRAFQKTRAKKK